MLTDTEVTRGALERIRGFLAPAGVDDTVVLLASGHGARDPGVQATFYFVTHEADRADLARTTIALDELEALVGGVKARRRLLLLDACQSGDLDPEALSSIRARAEANGLSVRATAGSDAGDARPRTYLAARDRYVYARLERRTGAVVFASSMGDEVSVESAALGSGVFTGAILRALSTPAADANRDGWITIDELEPAVKVLVGEVTHGLQHPNIDRENSLQTLRLPLLP